jgi:hypothetical protein
MTKQYLLLVPVKAADFSITIEELIEAAAEWSATLIKSKNMNGATSRYFMTNTLEAMESLCTNCNFDGTVVEVTGVYDQEIEEE